MSVDLDPLGERPVPPPAPPPASPPSASPPGGTDLLLRWVAALGIATGIAALLLDVFDVVAMPFTLTFVALPATVAVVALGGLTGRTPQFTIARRLVVGAVSGVAATAAYDLARAAVAFATPRNLDPFRAHPNFGALMLDTSPDTTAALVAGWGYHFWNGLTFAVLYTLLFGGARVRAAIAWAMTLEVATIAVTPRYTAIDTTDVFFVTVSLVGHLVYGTVLGVLARQWLQPDDMGGPGGVGGRGSARSPWDLTRPTWREGWR